MYRLYHQTVVVNWGQIIIRLMVMIIIVDVGELNYDGNIS